MVEPRQPAYPRTGVRPYLVALAAVAVAVVMTRLGWPIFQDTPLVPLFSSVVVATHFGNRRAGQLSVVLSILAAPLAFPPGGLNAWEPRTVVVYLVIGFLGNLVVDGRNRVEAALRASLEAQRRAERELRAKEEHLRRAQKTEAVAQLVAGVAHNFNNLLTVTLGYAELLMERHRGQEPDESDLQVIHDAAERGASLTRQLLAFGREHAADLRRLDMMAAISGLGELLARVVREDTRLEIDVPSEPAFIEIDPGDLQQVVLNLVLNARDALPAGGVVRVEAARERIEAPRTAHGQTIAPGEYARVQVHDNGVGMSPEAEAHLFEPFFTTKDVGKGTGLGLAFVYGIAQQRGGFVTVDTAPGKGTTVTMHIPIAPAGTVDAAASRGQARRAEGRGAGKGRATVLLVEDEDDVREVAQAILSRAGYRVLAAATPGEATGLFDRHAKEIDLLVTDVIMPEMHGPALARQLVARRPDLRVLFVSGHSDAMPMGTTPPGQSAFLAKPFPAASLITAADNLLS